MNGEDQSDQFGARNAATLPQLTCFSIRLPTQLEFGRLNESNLKVTRAVFGDFEGGLDFFLLHWNQKNFVRVLEFLCQQKNRPNFTIQSSHVAFLADDYTLSARGHHHLSTLRPCLLMPRPPRVKDGPGLFLRVLARPARLLQRHIRD